MDNAVRVHDIPGLSVRTPGRIVRVWTPRGYADSTTRRFPVLYLQDGQNLFAGRSRSKRVAWQADTTAQKLIDAKAIPPLIIVGIDNAGEKRTDDYAPVSWKGKGGRAAEYADLLVSEIKRFIDHAYRTKTGPESTAVGGSSLGGLFALYAGLRMPDIFGGIMAMSPSVFWAGDCIIEEVEESSPSGVRIWLDVGEHETATMRKGLRKAVKALIRSGWQRDRVAHLATLRASEDPQGRHDETSWGRRFGRALRFLFPIEQRVRPVARASAIGAEQSSRLEVRVGTRRRS